MTSLLIEDVFEPLDNHHLAGLVETNIQTMAS